MNRKFDRKKSILILGVLLAAALPISSASNVTLTQGVEIEQPENNLNINVTQEFNVSTLTAYDNATSFGGTNFSAIHGGSQTAYAQMPFFDKNATRGEDVTTFDINATSGTSLEIVFSNLTSNRYYALKKDGSYIGQAANMSSGEDGSFYYSTTAESGDHSYALEASVRDGISVNIDTDKEAASPNSSITVSGSATRNITGSAVENAEVNLYVDGNQLSTGGLTTDASGDFSYTYNTSKIAGDHTVEAVVQKNDVTGSSTADYQLDAIFLENASIESITGDNIVDVDNTPNATVKVYRNNQNPIDTVRYRVDKYALEFQGEMNNPAPKTETQTYYKELQGLDVSEEGSYNIEYRAESTLDGQTIYAKENLSVDFEVQNISVSVDTDQASYGKSTGDTVTITGEALKKTSETETVNVSGEEVNISVVNKSSGDLIDNFTTTTDSNGEFSADYSFVSEEGVREVEANVNNSDGIHGVGKTEFSVTDMNVDSHSFVDSSDVHGYKVQINASDSEQAINDQYECQVTAADGEGNTEQYQMDMNVSFDGNDNTARCTSPVIGASNNSGWDHLEQLETTAEFIDPDGVTATSIKSEKLPNNAPDVENISIDLDLQGDYRFTVKSVASDGDIPGENEITGCTVFYYDSQNNQYSASGNLDTSFGTSEQAKCTFSRTDTSSPIVENEVLDAEVKFTDTHGANSTSQRVDSPAPFEVDFENVNGDGLDTTVRFVDSETGNTVKTISSSNGEFYEPVPTDTYDVEIDALGKTVRLLDTTIDTHQKETITLDDTLTDSAAINPDQEPNIPQVTEQLNQLAVSGIGLPYSSSEIVFGYAESEEQTVSPWTCDISDIGAPVSCSSDYRLSEFDLDAATNEVVLSSGTAKGVYTTADSGGWKEGWLTRSVYEVNGTSQDLENYQVKLEVDTQGLISENNLNDDCSDIRFYGPTQNERIDHWLKPGSCGQNDSEVWVEVPDIPAESSRLVYMYTGNESLSSVSSGVDTFLDFDEFGSSLGSSYSTAGDVIPPESSELVLRSSDGTPSAVVYDGSTRSPPYRFMAEVEPEAESEVSRVGTFSEGSSLDYNSIFFGMNQGEYVNNYSSSQDSLNPITGTIDINEKITGDDQEITVLPDNETRNISGSISGSNYPFSASLKEDSGTTSSLRIDRWFTAKLAEPSPSVVKEQSSKNQWHLYLNDKKQDLQVGSEVPFEIKVNSSSEKNSDIEIFLAGESVATAADTLSTSVERNVSQNRYYEVRAYIANLDRSLVRDVIVGTDDEKPNVSVTTISQDGENVSLNYDVTDNYRGHVECEALVNDKVRKQQRVEIESANSDYSSNFSLSNLPDGDVQLGVRCSDQSGNQDVDQLPATADFEPPKINITKPVDGGKQIRVGPEFKIKLTDQSTQDINYTISYQDSSISKQGELSNDTLTTVNMKAPESYGDKTLAVTAKDKNGFKSDPVYIDLTLQKPEVSITSPSQNIDNSPFRTIYEKDTDCNEFECWTDYYNEDRKIVADRYPVDEENPTFEFDYNTQALSSTQCELFIDGSSEGTVSNAQVNQTESVTVSSIEQDINRTLEVKCDTAAGTQISSKKVIDVDREKPSLGRVRTNYDNRTTYNPNKEYELTAFISDNVEEPATDQTTSYPYLEINGSDGQIIMRSNFTGTFQNRSLACEEQTYYRDWYTDPDSQVCSDHYTAEVGNLDAGEYSYKYYIKDEGDNLRVTENRTYKVEAGSPGLSWNFKNDRARDGDIVRDTSPKLQCSAANQDAQLTLERTGPTGDTFTSSSGPVNDTTVLSTTGSYSYNCSVPATNSYNASHITLDMEVLDTVEDGINLTITSPETANSPEESHKEGTSDIVPETDNEWNITYGETQQTIKTSARSGTANLFFEGQDVSETYGISLTPGTYDIKSNSSGSARFTASSINKTLNVEKATPSLNLYTDPAYPEVDENFDVVCESTTAQSKIKVYFNDTLQNSGTADSISTTIDASHYGQGNYNIGCESEASENYTYEAAGRGPGFDDTSENPGDVFIDPNTATMNFNFEPSSEVVHLRNDYYAVENGTEVTVTCNTDEGVGTTLRKDGNVVEAPYTTTYTTLGDRNFECLSAETEIYDAGSEDKELSVQLRTNSTLLVDGESQDVTVTQEEVPGLNISAILNVSKAVQLREISNPDPNRDVLNPVNENLDGEILDSGSVLSNSPSQTVPGTYEFRAMHPTYQNGDYFGSSDDVSVTVQDVISPRMDLNGIQPGGQINTKDLTVRIKTRDYSEYTCSVALDGETRDVWVRDWVSDSEYSDDSQNPKTTWTEPDNNELTGEWYSHSGRIAKMNVTGLSQGVHTVSTSCEDESGNTRSISRNFVVDTTKPDVSIEESDPFQAGSSTPVVTVSASDNPFGGADVEIVNENTGEVLGSKEGVSGNYELGLQPLSPGSYTLRARGEDAAGNVGESGTTTMNVPDGIYDLTPSSFGNNDSTKYVNSQDVNLSYRYGSSSAPLDCTVGVNESGGLTDTYGPEQVSNNTIDWVQVNGLSNGRVNWNVSCGDGQGDASLFIESDFVVDVEDPVVESTWVSQNSGSIFENETVTFEITTDDNFEVDDANISASWLSTHNMECDDSGTCTYQTIVPPGDHNYSFTVCDEAGNCETTDTQDYSVVSTEETFELRLNNKTENVTLDNTTVLNVTGAIEGSERANMYFDINGSATAQALDSTGTQFQERFFTNGTYNVSANFISTESSRMDTDWLLVDVNVSRRQIDNYGYNIFGLPPGKNASLRNDPGFSPTIPRFGVAKEKEIILGDGLGTNLAAQVTVDFTDDLDASDMFFNQSKSERKSVIAFNRNYNMIQSHSLLVPREQNSGEVVVCPRADTLSEVQPGCTDGVNVSSGETVNGITNSETVVNGEKYYHITGISGTGAQELESDNNLEQDPAGANTTEIKTLNEYVDLSEDDALDVTGGNVTGANISGDQTTDDWAGIYGNATGTVNLGTEAVLYTWPANPKHVFAANDSVNWTTLQNATLSNVNSIYQLTGQTDDAQGTFNESTTLYFGSTNISASSVRTYNASESPTWVTAALSDGSTPVFTGKVRNNRTTSFNGEVSDYQMIIPTGGDGDELISYSMYVDLS